ncbi:hypothetical protein FNV43_RR12342 [Rhamnella rubrinervis]|uniref:Uncharacterized protein n=1 Tax=Rhamnella rubrinervis TaxID=2594499 RepID=A0A8K0H7B5_9ROSA|nr:hypothetical protein FNV43_RR12342 [Rhamnella rubrinervis]
MMLPGIPIIVSPFIFSHSPVSPIFTCSRVFLLGPYHHHYTPKWALSIASVYKTPIGDLPVDLEVIEELKATGNFEMMDMRVDEAQRSMEMHLLYLAKVFEGHPFKVVPIFVGALNAEATYRQLLAKYVDDPNNFFSVLSNFCHEGTRFNYMLYNKKCGSIYKSIEALDRVGMDIIETGDLGAFKQYLLEYENTIYGRHPISGFRHGRGQGIPFFPQPGQFTHPTTVVSSFEHGESSSVVGRRSSMEERPSSTQPFPPVPPSSTQPPLTATVNSPQGGSCIHITNLGQFINEGHIHFSAGRRTQPPLMPCSIQPLPPLPPTGTQSLPLSPTSTQPSLAATVHSPQGGQCIYITNHGHVTNMGHTHFS